MNTLMLKNDTIWSQAVIERYCDDLIVEWQSLLENKNSSEIPDLLGSLYRWSIKGTLFEK